MLYFITFTCYGSHLPGSAGGSFDHVRQAGKRKFLAQNAGLEEYSRVQMTQSPYLMAVQAQREAALNGIVTLCQDRNWYLYALHVRTNHVHGIVEADVLPPALLQFWKAHATRAMVQRAGEAQGVRRWTHGGSVRMLRNSHALTAALRYVVSGQGEPMALFCQNPGLGPDSSS